MSLGDSLAATDAVARAVIDAPWEADADGELGVIAERTAEAGTDSAAADGGGAPGTDPDGTEASDFEMAAWSDAEAKAAAETLLMAALSARGPLKRATAAGLLRRLFDAKPAVEAHVVTLHVPGIVSAATRVPLGSDPGPSAAACHLLAALADVPSVDQKVARSRGLSRCLRALSWESSVAVSLIQAAWRAHRYRGRPLLRPAEPLARRRVEVRAVIWAALLRERWRWLRSSSSGGVLGGLEVMYAVDLLTAVLRAARPAGWGGGAPPRDGCGLLAGVEDDEVDEEDDSGEDEDEAKAGEAGGRSGAAWAERLRAVELSGALAVLPGYLTHAHGGARAAVGRLLLELSQARWMRLPLVLSGALALVREALEAPGRGREEAHILAMEALEGHEDEEDDEEGGGGAEDGRGGGEGEESEVGGGEGEGSEGGQADRGEAQDGALPRRPAAGDDGHPDRIPDEAGEEAGGTDALAVAADASAGDGPGSGVGGRRSGLVAVGRPGAGIHGGAGEEADGPEEEDAEEEQDQWSELHIGDRLAALEVMDALARGPTSLAAPPRPLGAREEEEAGAGAGAEGAADAEAAAIAAKEAAERAAREQEEGLSGGVEVGEEPADAAMEGMYEDEALRRAGDGRFRTWAEGRLRRRLTHLLRVAREQGSGVLGEGTAAAAARWYSELERVGRLDDVTERETTAEQELRALAAKRAEAAEVEAAEAFRLSRLPDAPSRGLRLAPDDARRLQAPSEVLPGRAVIRPLLPALQDRDAAPSPRHEPGPVFDRAPLPLSARSAVTASTTASADGDPLDPVSAPYTGGHRQSEGRVDAVGGGFWRELLADSSLRRLCRLLCARDGATRLGAMAVLGTALEVGGQRPCRDPLLSSDGSAAQGAAAAGPDWATVVAGMLGRRRASMAALSAALASADPVLGPAAFRLVHCVAAASAPARRSLLRNGLHRLLLGACQQIPAGSPGHAMALSAVLLFADPSLPPPGGFAEAVGSGEVSRSAVGVVRRRLLRLVAGGTDRSTAAVVALVKLRAAGQVIRFLCGGVDGSAAAGGGDGGSRLSDSDSDDDDDDDDDEDVGFFEAREAAYAAAIVCECLSADDASHGELIGPRPLARLLGILQEARIEALVEAESGGARSAEAEREEDEDEDEDDGGAVAALALGAGALLRLAAQAACRCLYSLATSSSLGSTGRAAVLRAAVAMDSLPALVDAAGPAVAAMALAEEEEARAAGRGAVVRAEAARQLAEDALSGGVGAAETRERLSRRESTARAAQRAVRRVIRAQQRRAAAEATAEASTLLIGGLAPRFPVMEEEADGAAAGDALASAAAVGAAADGGAPTDGTSLRADAGAGARAGAGETAGAPPDELRRAARLAAGTAPPLCGLAAVTTSARVRSSALLALARLCGCPESTARVVAAGAVDLVLAFFPGLKGRTALYAAAAKRRLAEAGRKKGGGEGGVASAVSAVMEAEGEDEARFYRTVRRAVEAGDGAAIGGGGAAGSDPVTRRLARGALALEDGTVSVAPTDLESEAAWGDAADGAAGDATGASVDDVAAVGRSRGPVLGGSVALADAGDPHAGPLAPDGFGPGSAASATTVPGWVGEALAGGDTLTAVWASAARGRGADSEDRGDDTDAGRDRAADEAVSVLGEAAGRALRAASVSQMAVAGSSASARRPGARQAPGAEAATAAAAEGAAPPCTWLRPLGAVTARYAPPLWRAAAGRAAEQSVEAAAALAVGAHDVLDTPPTRRSNDTMRQPLAFWTLCAALCRHAGARRALARSGVLDAAIARFVAAGGRRRQDERARAEIAILLARCFGTVVEGWGDANGVVLACRRADGPPVDASSLGRRGIDVPGARVALARAMRSGRLEAAHGCSGAEPSVLADEAAAAAGVSAGPAAAAAVAAAAASTGASALSRGEREMSKQLGALLSPWEEDLAADVGRAAEDIAAGRSAAPTGSRGLGLGSPAMELAVSRAVGGGAVGGSGSGRERCVPVAGLVRLAAFGRTRRARYAGCLALSCLAQDAAAASGVLLREGAVPALASQLADPGAPHAVTASCLRALAALAASDQQAGGGREVMGPARRAVVMTGAVKYVRGLASVSPDGEGAEDRSVTLRRLATDVLEILGEEATLLGLGRAPGSRAPELRPPSHGHGAQEVWPAAAGPSDPRRLPHAVGWEDDDEQDDDDDDADGPALGDGGAPAAAAGAGAPKPRPPAVSGIATTHLRKPALSPLRSRPSLPPVAGLLAEPSLMSLASTIPAEPRQPRPGAAMLAEAGSLPGRVGPARLPPPFRRDRAPPASRTAPGEAEDPAFRTPAPRPDAASVRAGSTVDLAGFSRSALGSLASARSDADRAIAAASRALGARGTVTGGSGPGQTGQAPARAGASAAGRHATSAAQLQQRAAAKAGLLDPSFGRSARGGGQASRSAGSALDSRRRADARAAGAASARRTGRAADPAAVAASRARLLGRAGGEAPRGRVHEDLERRAAEERDGRARR